MGLLETKDDAGIDPKIIMCPSKKVDPKYDAFLCIYDIPSSIRERIQYFFTHYKDLENKKVEIGNWLDKSDAIQIYITSVNNYIKL